MIESAIFEIKGKEYTCLKPYACDIIDIEDQSYDDSGKFNGYKYASLILRLVTKEVTIDDLVEFNKEPIVLSSGEKIFPQHIEFKDYLNTVYEVERKRVDAAKRMLNICGIEGDIKIQNFSYKDIMTLAGRYYTLYNSDELDEVVGKITNFCLSEQDIEGNESE